MHKNKILAHLRVQTNLGGGGGWELTAWGACLKAMKLHYRSQKWWKKESSCFVPCSEVLLSHEKNIFKNCLSQTILKNGNKFVFVYKK